MPQAELSFCELPPFVSLSQESTYVHLTPLNLVNEEEGTKKEKLPQNDTQKKRKEKESAVPLRVTSMSVWMVNRRLASLPSHATLLKLPAKELLKGYRHDINFCLKINK